MAGRDAVVAALLIWAALVAVTDWRVRRVPNLLLLALLVPAGAVLLWRGEGLLGVNALTSLVGLFIGLLVTLPGYLVSRFGAGDVKLAVSLGFVQGANSLLPSLMLAGLVLGLMALLAWLWLGSESSRPVRLPAAVALCSGFAVVVVVSRWG